jgi:glyoxylase-like metal-dependent hydrolase (beta-lactamase superfamily II)
MSSDAPVMIGLTLPDLAAWSERVQVVLGQNPGTFTGPGTNTFLIGTGSRRILLDTGDGTPAYLPLLERAMEEAGCGLQEIVLTHGHRDHIGGVRAVTDRFGPLPVSKRPWPEIDGAYPLELTPIGEGDVVRAEGATLRAIHTPGHARDHLCFLLEEERSLFSGDHILGIGTAVIPGHGGSLSDYMRSLRRLLEEEPRVIYPAHGPRIDDGSAKIREYIAHRQEREQQILAALGDGRERIPEMVAQIYAAYPASLHAAAAQSVCAHLLELEREGRVSRDTEGDPLAARWVLT